MGGLASLRLDDAIGDPESFRVVEMEKHRGRSGLGIPRLEGVRDGEMILEALFESLR